MLIPHRHHQEGHLILGEFERLSQALVLKGRHDSGPQARTLGRDASPMNGRTPAILSANHFAILQGCFSAAGVLS